MFRLGFYCTLSGNKQYSIGSLHFYVMFFHYIIHGKLPWFTSHSVCMADRTGEMKKGRSGPMSPKCSMLKQLPPVSALREYYNSEVPGAYQRIKMPSS